MKLVDTPPVPTFDPAAFATYNNPEDANPTEAELVEDLPEHLMPPKIEQSNEPPPPRRGKGYLRAEIPAEADSIDDDFDAVEETPDDAFGAGLDVPLKPETSRTADREATSRDNFSTAPTTPSDTDSDGREVREGRGRNRRRQRGKRSRNDAPSAKSPDANTSQHARSKVVDQNPIASGEGSPKNTAPEDAAPGTGSGDSSRSGRKRRRRRRGRRGKSD